MLDRALVGIAQWLPLPGRPQDNLEVAIGAIGELGRRGCDLIVLPELWPSGFAWNTLAEDVRVAAEPLDGPRTKALAGAVASAGAWLVGGSVPEREGTDVFNTLLLFDRTGELRATHRKTHLYAPLGEDRAVSAGSRLTVCGTDEFGVVGLSICFDGDFPEVARAMRLARARVVVHPSAYEVSAGTWWDTLYPANALANGQWWIMANQCGTNSSGTLLGASQVVSPFGKIVAQAVRASEGQSPDPQLLVAEIELRAELDRAEVRNSVLWGLRRESLYLDGATESNQVRSRMGVGTTQPPGPPVRDAVTEVDSESSRIENAR